VLILASVEVGFPFGVRQRNSCLKDLGIVSLRSGLSCIDVTCTRVFLRHVADNEQTISHHTCGSCARTECALGRDRHRSGDGRDKQVLPGPGVFDNVADRENVR